MSNLVTKSPDGVHGRGPVGETIADAGMLSRIAGDEFVCLLNDCSRAESINLAAHALGEISRLELEVRPGQYARVGLAFGVAEFPRDGQSIDELLNLAALATRQNKTSLIPDKPVSQSSALPYSHSQKSGPLTLVG